MQHLKACQQIVARYEDQWFGQRYCERTQKLIRFGSRLSMIELYLIGFSIPLRPIQIPTLDFFEPQDAEVVLFHLNKLVEWNQHRVDIVL